MDDNTQSKATVTTAADKTAGKWCCQKRQVYWGAILVSGILLLVAAYQAIRWLGYLCGWVIGASQSPIAAAALPLLFTLLGAVGLRAGFRNRRPKLWNIICLIGLSAGAAVFCDYCETGITIGSVTREDQYKTMADLIGENWAAVDADTKSRLYQFRWLAQDSKLPYREYELFVAEVVKPLLDAKADKQTELIRELAVVEEVLHRPDVAPPSKAPDRPSSRPSPK